MRIVNPATETLLAEVAEDTAATIADKFAQAATGQHDWARVALADRVRIVAAFADGLERHRDRLAEILTDEMGKPLAQARNEIAATPARVRYFAEHVGSVLAEQSVYAEAGLDEVIGYEPLGIIANVSAWNYPYFVGTNVIAPALLTGNAVLYKPSEYATLTGLEISRLLHNCGVPEEVMMTVVGDGTVGAELLRQPLDAVFFTGSYRTGRRIAAAAAEQLMKVQLELGGKDPAYVCEDVDPPQAAAALADGAFYNAGQSCCAVERLYVHARVYGAFVEAFVATVEAFRVGNPRTDGMYIGPLARAPQLAVLEAQVRDALERGARLLCGGHRREGPGYFFEPTVLVDVTHDMQVMVEESFGPVIGIQRVSDDDEAVTLMNDTPYGLTAAVYTGDRARARNILAALDTGTVYWNCCDRVSPHLPWSGRKHSGLGSTLSIEGIRALVQPKAWHLKS